MAAVTHGPTLCEFLMEAELAHYLNPLKNDLKINSIAQLKYVDQDDLCQLGMTKPEQRRLWKHFQKYFPQTYLRKIKNIIKSKNKKDANRSSIYVVDNSLDKCNVKVPSKHIIPFENIVLNKQLGVGEFGVVQQGVWTNEDGERIQVAIKCLSEEKMQKNHMEFLKEAAIMHTIDHESIVHLYGVVLETNALMLITELAPLRSLLECLKEPALRPSFPVISLCDFAFQICDGMQYLENKKLIHRDLAARNILVFAKNKVKISDFGLSRALGVGKDYYQTNFNVNLKLPIAWCAPECINYLRFTSASDVWAYGVTLWEMFSYGFQPWAALTGQQILEAIDEPNFQRLEQPECCPKEYYTLMSKCWQHDANKRPKFVDILQFLPEYKPIQVQAIQDFVDTSSSSKPKKECLKFHTGDIITVLDKRPLSDNLNLWKGVLNSGKSGLFNPAQTVSYLGQNLPSTRPPSFSRFDGKSGIYGSKRRLRTDMISRPQGDFKHTGHVGLDGAFFGDISFLGDKYHQLPKQVVAPYKPQDDKENVSPGLSAAASDASDKTPLLISMNTCTSNNSGLAADNWSEVFSEKEGASTLASDKPSKKAHHSGATRKGTFPPDHEYHEISDNDEDDFSLIDNTKFESLDFGPSLMDEVLMALSTPRSADEFPEHKVIETPVNSDNSCKTSKENVKKKHAVVKPISAADQQTLDSAIAMAKELASKSMLELDCKSDNDTPVESPKTPNSPLKRRFSFKFKTSPKTDKRNFSEEAEAIPDIQDIITEEAKEAYNSLVQKGQVLSQSVSLPTALTLMPVSCAINNRNQSRKCSQPNPSGVQPADSDVPDGELNDASPLRMLRSGFPMKPKFRGNRHGIPGSGRAATPHTATVARIAANAGMNSVLTSGSRPAPSVQPPPPPSKNSVSAGAAKESGDRISPVDSSKTDSWTEAKAGDLSDSSSTNTSVSCGDGCPDSLSNPLPLPPRDRSKPLPVLKHHQRKYPLHIPGSASFSDSSHSLMKQASCPDVPSQSTSQLAVQVERRASEGGAPPSLVATSSAPATSVSSSLLCSSRTSRGNLPPPPPKPARTFNLDDMLESQIQAEMDSLKSANGEDPQVMYKGGDHVSCEDLLEFALDKPNARRTQGRARGIDSDEVRIMQKVLANEHVMPEECLVALNETDWDVHKAIKYQKLQCIISVHSISVDNSKQTLEKCDWDVQQAANYLLSAHSAVEDTTEV